MNSATRRMMLAALSASLAMGSTAPLNNGYNMPNNKPERKVRHVEENEVRMAKAEAKRRRRETKRLASRS